MKNYMEDFQSTGGKKIKTTCSCKSTPMTLFSQCLTESLRVQATIQRAPFSMCNGFCLLFPLTAASHITSQNTSEMLLKFKRAFLCAVKGKTSLHTEGGIISK